MSNEKRILKGDLHIHTHHSLDSNLSPKSIIGRAKELGMDFVGVVDHGGIEGGKETEMLAKRIAKGLIVLPGEEIRTTEGEIIAFNISRSVPQLMGLIETCEIVRDLGGFIVLPHPFDSFRSGLGRSANKIVRYVDAVEVFNARTVLDIFNKRAVKFSEDNKLPLIAGSDAHFVEEIGMGMTLIDSAKNKESIFKAIKSGKTEIMSRKSGIKPHIKTFIQKRFK